MTSQLPRFRWCYCCWQLRKRHQKGAAVMSLRSFSFCDDFNILRFKLLDLISSIVPSVWQKLSRGMSKPTTSKKWENPNIFFFISFHIHTFLTEASHKFTFLFVLLFCFTYTFTYLLYEGSSMKFWSTGVPCLDVMGLDTPLESFCHTEGTVDK